MLEKQSKKKNQLNSYIKYSSLATQMAIIICFGFFFGDILDKKHNTNSSFYTIIFSLFFVFLAMYITIKKAINKNEEN